MPAEYLVSLGLWRGLEVAAKLYAKQQHVESQQCHGSVCAHAHVCLNV